MSQHYQRMILVMGILGFAACGAPRPDSLGERDGTLGPCPGTPNCVQTGLRHPSGTVGLYLDGSIYRDDLMPRLRAVVEAIPRTRIVTVTDRYIYAEVTSRVFRFVDDLELLIAMDGELIVRSASRVGNGDLGVNAKRVEQLRDALIEAGLIR